MLNVIAIQHADMNFITDSWSESHVSHSPQFSTKQILFLSKLIKLYHSRIIR